MGIKDFFRLFTNEEAFCDKYRQLIENLYKQARKTEDPSGAIALIYYKHIKAMGWQVTENDADYQAHRLSSLAEPAFGLMCFVVGLPVALPTQYSNRLRSV